MLTGFVCVTVLGLNYWLEVSFVLNRTKNILTNNNFWLQERSRVCELDRGVANSN